MLETGKLSKAAITVKISDNRRSEEEISICVIFLVVKVTPE